MTDFATRDNWDAIDTAIDALDGALGLSRPGAAWLLVIVSDGDFRPWTPPHRAAAARPVARHRMRRVVDHPGRPGAQTHDPRDHARNDRPHHTAQVIGRAATAALRATQ